MFLNQLLRTARSITLTPISDNEEKESRRDYNQQIANELEGNNVIWDDTKTPLNSSRVGDLFGFVFESGSYGDGRVEYRRIIAILPPTARDATWRIPEHKDRQVLVLSPKLFESTWIQFLVATGKQTIGKRGPRGVRNPPLQGTKRRGI